MSNARRSAPARRRAAADTDEPVVAPAPTDQEDSSADSEVLEQDVAPEGLREVVIPAAVPAEEQENAAQVDEKRYPERPYSEAVSDSHREYLKGLGREL